MRTCAVLISIGLFAAPAWAQPARPSEQRNPATEIRISDSGILDETFRDGPAPRSLADLPDAAEIHFRNESLTVDLEVRIEELSRIAVARTSIRFVTVGELRKANPNRTAVNFVVLRADGSPIPNSLGRLVVSRPAVAPTAAQSAVTQALVTELITQVDQQTRRAAALVRDLTKTPPAPAVAPAPAAMPVLKRVRTVAIPLSGVGVDDWNFRNLRNPPYLLPTEPADDLAIFIAQLRDYLDAVRSTDLPGKTDAELARLAVLFATEINFLNDSIDRTFTIAVDIPALATDAKSRADFEARSGLKLSECSSAAPTCKVLISLPPRTPRTVQARWLAGFSTDPKADATTWFNRINTPQPAVQFTVAFFDEVATPAEPSAYVALVPYSSLREPSSRTSWLLAPTIGAAREPLIVRDIATTLSDSAAPYDGQVKRTFTGSAKLTLRQTLGARADAVVDVSFKSGPLSTEQYKGEVTVPMYQVNIHSVPGFRLSFGRFQFAAPAGGIAIREAGEGFRVSFRNRMAFSHVIKRESRTGAADGENLDHRVYLVEANNIAGRRWDTVRAINLIAAIGHDRDPAKKRTYWTAGTDVQFSVPDSPLSGTAAYYHSDRKPDDSATDPSVVRATGDTGFTAFGYTFFQPAKPGQASRKVAATLRGEWGIGSGNRPGATSDRSYLGETAAAPGEAFFLNTFAPRMTTVSKTVGLLRNKQYFAAVYQEERFTLLDLVAKFLKFNRDDVASRLMRAGARSYYFKHDISEGNSQHHAGTELFGESLIETPSGVKTSLAVTYFRPGSAVRDYFLKRGVWSVTSRVTVVLGG